MSEELHCGICGRDIRKLGCHPIYSEKFDVICSHCCLIGCLYHLKHISEEHLTPIPKKVRDKIKRIYESDIKNGKETEKNSK